MNAKAGKPQGTDGTVTFDASVYAPARTVKAVRDTEGRVWVQAANPHLWLPTTVRDDQWTAA